MVSKKKKSGVSRGKKVSKSNGISNRNILVGVAFVVALLVAGFYIGGYGVTGNVAYEDEYGNPTGEGNYEDDAYSCDPACKTGYICSGEVCSWFDPCYTEVYDDEGMPETEGKDCEDYDGNSGTCSILWCDTSPSFDEAFEELGFIDSVVKAISDFGNNIAKFFGGESSSCDPACFGEYPECVNGGCYECNYNIDNNYESEYGNYHVDCANGKECVAGTCYDYIPFDDGTCEDDTDCMNSDFPICDTGYCWQCKYEFGVGSIGCDPGIECVAGICGVGGGEFCTIDDDCTVPGDICSFGTCVLDFTDDTCEGDGYCESNSDCNEDEFCVENGCRECDYLALGTGGCEPGNYCFDDGSCVWGSPPACTGSVRGTVQDPGTPCTIDGGGSGICDGITDICIDYMPSCSDDGSGFDDDYSPFGIPDYSELSGLDPHDHSDLSALDPNEFDVGFTRSSIEKVLVSETNSFVINNHAFTIQEVLDLREMNADAKYYVEHFRATRSLAFANNIKTPEAINLANKLDARKPIMSGLQGSLAEARRIRDLQPASSDFYRTANNVVQRLKSALRIGRQLEPMLRAIRNPVMTSTRTSSVTLGCGFAGAYPLIEYTLPKIKNAVKLIKLTPTGVAAEVIILESIVLISLIDQLNEVHLELDKLRDIGLELDIKNTCGRTNSHREQLCTLLGPLCDINSPNPISDDVVTRLNQDPGLLARELGGTLDQQEDFIWRANEYKIASAKCKEFKRRYDLRKGNIRPSGLCIPT